jgi:hypothetical protein
MAIGAVRMKVIEEPMPFGDVPLAPRDATGRSEAELARAIAEGLRESATQPHERDPSPPLTARLMRRASRSGAQVSARKRAA